MGDSWWFFIIMWLIDTGTGTHGPGTNPGMSSQVIQWSGTAQQDFQPDAGPARKYLQIRDTNPRSQGKLISPTFPA